MAAGTIITVLSNIPWGQVVENAPKVADGAAKLWNAVTRKTREQSPEANEVAGAETSGTAAFERRLGAMEAHIRHLEEQMSASAELIKALAEQNTQLVGKIEVNSARLRRLAAAAAIGVAALVGAIVFLLLRS